VRAQVLAVLRRELDELLRVAPADVAADDLLAALAARAPRPRTRPPA
jgi:hypothetical protein